MIERRGFVFGLLAAPLSLLKGFWKEESDDYEPQDGWKGCAFRYMSQLRYEKENRDLDKYIYDDNEKYLAGREKYCRERFETAEKDLESREEDIKKALIEFSKLGPADGNMFCFHPTYSEGRYTEAYKHWFKGMQMLNNSTGKYSHEDCLIGEGK